MNTSTTNYVPSDNQELQSKVTRKGQVTVPADIRTLLDLKKGDNIAFVVNKSNRVEVTKKASIVAQTAGILKSNVPPLTAEELRKKAEQIAAQEAIERSR